MKHKTNPKILLIISMVIFGTIGVFTRHISLSSSELALYRAILASLLIGGYLWITKQSIQLRNIKHEALLLLFSGMAMGINWILLFEAYKYTTISLATLSYYFAPTIVTLICPFLFHEKLTKKQIICFVMSTIGLIFIIGVNEISETNFVGILFGLGAAVFYALVILLNKYIQNIDGIQRTFLQFLAAILILFPYVLVNGGSSLLSLSFTGWVCLLIVGVVHTGITYCLYFSALKELKGQEAAILSYIDSLVAVLVSVFVLHEALSLPQILGGILVIGFAIYNEFK